MKPKTKKIIAWGVLCWFMLGMISYVTMFAGVSESHPFDSSIIPVVFLSTFFFGITLYLTRGIVGKKNANIIALLLLLFIACTVTYHFVFAPYNHYKFWY